MSILANPAFIGQFSVIPPVPGILIPDPASPYTAKYPLTPGATDHAYVLGNINRQIRCEAAQSKFEHVPMNNHDLTLLRDPSNPGKDVEVAFYYANGTELPRFRGKAFDLSTQSFSARTTITYSVQQDQQTVKSYASKTVAAAQSLDLRQRALMDKHIELHLTGPTLSEFWQSHPFLKQYDLTDTASVAIAFSIYLFHKIGCYGSLEHGLFIVDAGARGMIGRPFYKEIFDLSGSHGPSEVRRGKNFKDLKEIVDSVRHPKRGILITSRPLGVEDTFFCRANMPFKLEMCFRAPDFKYGPTNGETHIELTISAIGGEHIVTLDDELLLGIWKHIMDRVSA